MIRLSNFVELINLANGTWKWRFQPRTAGLLNKGRTDQGPYEERAAALKAAAKALKESLGHEVTIDNPPETSRGLPPRGARKGQKHRHGRYPTSL